ncbi:2-phospho-L-lactate guanylyltransferase [Pirellulimonas nuda]|uniref:2-phospho-L-lactate guanylyltransferase n=1 Tax=Pirellulimonas nuda TaxID=2528009 RepID=A0A518DAW7_9BACT|nr:TIGR04282 family arsenosugar biosynthesis glycosyltransferase [Pirellulimonas nuda]QDU88593.1 2-phospho-L-lactate guanylyltransferase [Pirellulimonas nuda]
MTHSLQRVALFAKHWTPGLVKTRLSVSIGQHGAAHLHRAFLATLTERLSTLEAQRALCYAPADQRDAFAPFAARGWELCEQSAGDLGERLEDFFDRSFAAGYQRVVVLGADSPNLELRLVVEAFAELRQRDLVLGPARDGGYYLVGARGGTPPIFRGMPWGQDALFQATLNRLASAGWGADRFAVLPSWYDVDEMDDLRELSRDLRGASQPSLVRLRAAIEPYLSADGDRDDPR